MNYNLSFKEYLNKFCENNNVTKTNAVTKYLDNVEGIK